MFKWLQSVWRDVSGQNKAETEEAHLRARLHSHVSQADVPGVPDSDAKEDDSDDYFDDDDEDPAFVESPYTEPKVSEPESQDWYGGRPDGEVHPADEEPAAHGTTMYRFEHITDLLEVPDELLETCLKEMVLAVRTVRMAVTAARAGGDNRPVRQMIEHLTWQDDGEKDAHVRINVGEGSVVISTRSAPTPEPIPKGHYFDVDSEEFFNDVAEDHLPMSFWTKWQSRRNEFPPLPERPHHD